jgi:phosphatidylinositol dimannoside acyltransferase
VSQRLVVTGYLLGWRLLRHLPERTAYALFRLIADRIWRRRGPSVVQLERNLARVVGRDTPPAELAALSRRAMRSYLRYWCDAFRLPVWTPEQIERGLVVEGIEHVDAANAAGKGMLFALPHMGNWDLAGAWAVRYLDRPLVTVAERLRPAELFDRFVAYRTGLGMEVLPLDGGPTVFGLLARRLRSAGLVCLIADRDMTASGVDVEFFGEAARMPAGPAALALQTGAALFPVTLWYDDDGARARVNPPVEAPETGTRPQKIAAMTQLMADTFGRGIAEHPADWHMLQRIWLADLDGDRLLAVTGADTVPEPKRPPGAEQPATPAAEA